MNDFDNLIGILTEYSKSNLTLRELDTNFTELFIESDHEYTEEQSDILEDINTDIGYTAREPYTKEDKAIGLFNEEQLRKKITNHLKNLAIEA